ncbi:hypothetical protein AA313_de0208235 [Arthrobotrys entomopaga]|nr:hypothetical protein AA313_de0208235 [Arthrobotrys entomopaga]
MKGAGSSFAIVTHFTQKVWTQGQYNAGFVFYPVTSIPAVFSALYTYSTDTVLSNPLTHIIPAVTSVGPEVTLSSMGLSSLPTNVTDLAAFCFFYPSPLTQELDAFKPFTQNIPSLASTRSNRMGINSISSEIPLYNPAGRRQSFTDMSIVLTDPTALQSLYDAYQAATQSYRLRIVGYISSFINYPLHRNFVAAGTANGMKNSMGIEDSAAGKAGQTVMIVSINLTWNLQSQDTLAAECVGVGFAAMRALAGSKGWLHPFQYMNYANGTQDVINGYGSISVARLRAIKAVVDPMDDFATLVTGRYRIPGF